ncbi:MAG TPA: FtsQ-type POTRA domain-containing protein [Bryobacteraceae bacterium]|nr:FtsQ-type POTRA domain-containing protein [Bryobacteraceae bacterium]
MPADSKKRRSSSGVVMRYTALAAGMGLLLTGAIYGSQQFEQFLIRDPRFFLPGPPDYGLESPNLEVHGVRYVSRARVLHVFEPDYGRSLYLLPMAERRKQLLSLRWIHDVSIARIWPNRVLVEITERKPAAFLQLPADGMARWALIDNEGVILDPPPKAPFKLPVLTGVLRAENQDRRAVRVRRMQRLMQELGPMAGNVSEVDVADLDNLKITEQVGGSAVSLMLGDRNFASRVRNFLDAYPDIHRRMPQAASFDLRLDDRITGLGAIDGQ